MAAVSTEEIVREVFLESGTFTVPAGVEGVSVLVVGAGGGGGSRQGGGGGGGGLRYEGVAVIPGEEVSVVVGDGGLGGAPGKGTNGGNSSFGQLVSLGGGGGGGRNDVGGGESGGCGGGAADGGFGGEGEAWQGFAGGDAGLSIGSNIGGGGGGAGAEGVDGIEGDTRVEGYGGAGGAGRFFPDFEELGDSGWFAGGGGGGVGPDADENGEGGQGGGGAGGFGPALPANGVPNTGGGGGGAGGSSDNPGVGGTGGSGIVIVSYKNPGVGQSVQISGSVSLKEQSDVHAVSREVLAIQRSPTNWNAVGWARSDSESGLYSITGLVEPGTDVYLLTIDERGTGFSSASLVDVGDLIHPTTPNGYVYRVVTAGTLPATEPQWWTTGQQQIGTATLEAREYLRPLAHGPVPVTFL